MEISQSALLLRGKSPSNKTIPRGVKSLPLPEYILHLEKMFGKGSMGSAIDILCCLLHVLFEVHSEHNGQAIEPRAVLSDAAYCSTAWRTHYVALPAAGADIRLHHRLQVDRLFRKYFLEPEYPRKTLTAARCPQHRACTRSGCDPHQSWTECHTDCPLLCSAGGMSRGSRLLARQNRQNRHPLQRC